MVLVFGIIVATTGIQPLTIIMVAQAVNGVFLPVIVFTTVYLTSRKEIMGEYTNSMLSNILGGAIFIISLVIGVSSLLELL